MVYSYPEAARERDLHKYYRPWLDAQSLENAHGIGTKGLSREDYHPQSSHDRALTAFAQLAALRLDTRRAMVSLIDSNRQYILAEATRTVSLLTANAEHPEDQVWLGNVIVSRADAMCYHTFSSTYRAKEENGPDYETQCMVIPDCRLDRRFADRDYVKGQPGVRFYAGVPIITRSGHSIGVYAVSDDRPREGPRAAEIRFMEDVAATVMEHLELAKDKHDRTRGERMVRGLTQFIERSSVQDMRDEAATRATLMERQTENARLDTLDEDEAGAQQATVSTIRRVQSRRDKETDVTRIFQRAARIIRQSTDADGVVFFDTSAASISALLAPHEITSAPPSSDESAAHTNTTDLDTCDSTPSRQRRRKKVTFIDNAADGVKSNNTACPIAALSLRPGNVALARADFAFTENAMERYISRFPSGKFFNYSEDGVGINSSDEKSQTSETEQSDRTETEPANSTAPKSKKKKDKFYPSEFVKVLPKVRSLIFIPLWDHSSERWVAGGFIWTTQAGRLMSPEHELPYLQAFGNSIISEVARLDAQKADKAKTTFIASISHELRSPLHGILGSVELIRDTTVSAYQDSLVSAIEVSGRVLLDTIDHVLDYAKINKLRSANARKKSRGETPSKRLPVENSILGVTADFDLAQLVEEVCDTVCAGHTFRKNKNANGGTIYDPAENAPEQPKHADGETITRKGPADAVVVSLVVAPHVNWIVQSQPGALRRIVMNLVGNSLKYTDSGHISISLLQNSITSKSIGVSLIVEDSGRGMSPEYQHTKLFSPFSQEDPFSTGTGLGLSIVKQIVESLRGDIAVESSVNVGTQIKVNMRLPCGQPENVKHEKPPLHASEKLQGLYFSILFHSMRTDKRTLSAKDSIEMACRNLNMPLKDVDIFANDFATDVDVLIVDSSSFDKLLTKSSTQATRKEPLSVICICTDTAEKTALELRIVGQLDALGWVAEIVVQPCGPRKLSRVMLACRSRATRKAAESQELTRPATTLAIPQHDQSLAPPPPTHRSLSDTHAQDNPFQSGPSPPIPAPIPSTITPPSPSQEGANSYFAPPRVLLVDDNAINLKLLVVFAKRQSLHYTEATNGLEALQTYERAATSTNPPTRPFDYILMDIQMPILDGLASTRQIRAYEQKMGLQRSYIVALTGLASAQDQEDATDAGVDTYLVKPVKFADIQRVFGAK